MEMSSAEVQVLSLRSLAEIHTPTLRIWDVFTVLPQSQSPAIRRSSVLYMAVVTWLMWEKRLPLLLLKLRAGLYLMLQICISIVSDTSMLMPCRLSISWAVMCSERCLLVVRDACVQRLPTIQSLDVLRAMHLCMWLTVLCLMAQSLYLRYGTVSSADVPMVPLTATPTSISRAESLVITSLVEVLAMLLMILQKQVQETVMALMQM